MALFSFHQLLASWGKITAISYTHNILISLVVSNYHTQHPFHSDSDYTMENKASVQTARFTSTALIEHAIPLLPWPGLSPDQNPTTEVQHRRKNFLYPMDQRHITVWWYKREKGGWNNTCSICRRRAVFGVSEGVATRELIYPDCRRAKEHSPSYLFIYLHIHISHLIHKLLFHLLWHVPIICSLSYIHKSVLD